MKLILCVKHARQVVNEGEWPSGHCYPDEQWIGGDGQVRSCETISAPEKVREHLANKRPVSSPNAARPAGDGGKQTFSERDT